MNTVAVAAPVVQREVVMGRILTLAKQGACTVVVAAVLAGMPRLPAVRVQTVPCGLFGAQAALFLQPIRVMSDVD